MKLIVIYHLRPYIYLLDAYLEKRLTPHEFQSILMPLFKRDPVTRPQDIYEDLNRVFLAAEGFDDLLDASDDYAVTESDLYSIASQVRLDLAEVAADELAPDDHDA